MTDILLVSLDSSSRKFLANRLLYADPGWQPCKSLSEPTLLSSPLLSACVCCLVLRLISRGLHKGEQREVVSWEQCDDLSPRQVLSFGLSIHERIVPFGCSIWSLVAVSQLGTHVGDTLRMEIPVGDVLLVCLYGHSDHAFCKHQHSREEAPIVPLSDLADPFHGFGDVMVWLCCVFLQCMRARLCI